MTKAQAVALREKWKYRVSRYSCQHRNQEMERGEDGIVTATYYCCTCGIVVLRISTPKEKREALAKTTFPPKALKKAL